MIHRLACASTAPRPHPHLLTTQVQPAPDDLTPSRDAIKVLEAASKASKDRGDSYTGVDVLLLAALAAPDVAPLLSEAGVNRQQLEEAVKEVRKAGAAPIDTESADQNFEALTK